MIQVDVFWSFAMGASLAAAASERLKSESSLVVNHYFMYAVVYLSCVFAPSGVYLLWEHTGWETMFFFSDTEIHGLLSCLFAMTNVLLGIVGFLIAGLLIKRDSTTFVHALWTVPYTCMFAILSFGYDRFMYPGTLEEWRRGVKYSLSDFFHCQVFYTLLIMGLFVIPPLFYAIIMWPAGPKMNSDRKWTLLGEAFTPYYRITGFIITIYVTLWKFTSLLPIGWGVDRLFAFLIGQSVFGATIFAPFYFIPVADSKKIKFRRD